MTTFKAIIWEVFAFFVLTNDRQILCEVDKDVTQRYTEGLAIAQATTITFMNLFEGCLQTSMPNQQFITDNLQKHIMFPAKTTVGFAPKFTSNRKFFANMITTTAFKEMLAKDEDEFRRNIIRKMKYCDMAIMDQDLLKDFYDREVDQSKI